MGRKPRAQSRQRLAGLDREEVIAAVCRYFCEGKTTTEVKDLVNKKLNTNLNREDPLRYLAYAATEGRLQYNAPRDAELTLAITERYNWLEKAHVVTTSTLSDVAQFGAEMLLGLVRACYRSSKEKHSTIRIGFGGGRALRILARRFSELLSRAAPTDLPETIVFHSMIGGGLEGPVTNPNSFFAYLMNDTLSGVNIDFVGFPVPDVVKISEFKNLQKLEAVQRARREAEELDIIVSSAGCWIDEHSRFRSMLADRLSKKSLQAFGKKCVGDVLWRPLGPEGAISDPREVRSMTLLAELTDVSARVSTGTQVLLVVGPCGQCFKPRSEVLQAIFNVNPPFFTHLVVDSRSARPLFADVR